MKDIVRRIVWLAVTVAGAALAEDSLGRGSTRRVAPWRWPLWGWAL